MGMWMTRGKYEVELTMTYVGKINEFDAITLTLGSFFLLSGSLLLIETNCRNCGVSQLLKRSMPEQV